MTSVTTGPRVIFLMNDSPVFFASAVNYSVSHELQPTEVLDQLDPAEYAETGYKVTFTCTMFRVPGRPTTGVLRPRFKDIIRQPELKAQLIDQVTSEVLFTINRVKCNQEDFQIDSRSIGQLTLSFVGITHNDEA